ncbi:MAG: methionyl-tRNA formyltransferase, partial [Phycisphaerae bacterium]|nr:methionyl-tRNA formyltransferase [Phycisphaerae bacterium]
MRIVYMGSGEFGCETLRRLLEIGHDIVQVITQPARPAGRGRHLMPTPIARLAQELSLPVLEVANVNA